MSGQGAIRSARESLLGPQKPWGATLHPAPSKGAGNGLDLVPIDREVSHRGEDIR